MTGTAVTEAEEFFKIYKLEVVDIPTNKPYLIGIDGLAGSGKTTLLRALAGLIQPTRGDIWIDGILKTPANVGIKSRIGYVGHSPHLYPHLTAHENLLFLARLFEIPDHRERIAVTLDAIGLSAQADRLVREFSRGMQQRLALGAAMLHNPLVLLLDEPSTGLDTDGPTALPAMLETLAPNAAVLLSTHDCLLYTSPSPRD